MAALQITGSGGRWNAGFGLVSLHRTRLVCSGEPFLNLIVIHDQVHPYTIEFKRTYSAAIRIITGAKVKYDQMYASANLSRSQS